MLTAYVNSYEAELFQDYGLDGDKSQHMPRKS